MNIMPLNYDSEQSPVIMMPEIIVTAFRNSSVAATAGQTINLKNTIIMPEIVVTAKKSDSAKKQNRYPALTSRPNNRQSFDQIFNIFGLLLLFSSLPLIWFFYQRAKTARLNAFTVCKECPKSKLTI